MPKILTKNSTEYLRTDIEHGQLFETNSGLLTIVNPADLLPSNSTAFAAKFHTTGNGIVYFSGRAVLQQAITGGTILFTFPISIAPVVPKTFRATLADAPSFSFLVLGVQRGSTQGQIVAVHDFGAASNQILFEPSFYLQG